MLKDLHYSNMPSLNKKYRSCHHQKESSSQQV
ncbi:hypothetical protein CP8484711_1260A, partial [Chlamydia psittaci 84-8471/1]